VSPLNATQGFAVNTDIRFCHENPTPRFGARSLGRPATRRTGPPDAVGRRRRASPPPPPPRPGRAGEPAPAPGPAPHARSSPLPPPIPRRLLPPPGLPPLPPPRGVPQPPSSPSRAHHHINRRPAMHAPAVMRPVVQRHVAVLFPPPRHHVARQVRQPAPLVPVP